MTGFVIFLTLTAAVILLFGGAVSIRVSYYEELVIDFDFLFASLSLYPQRKKKKRKKKKKLLKKIKKGANLLFYSKFAIDYLLSNSKTSVNSLKINTLRENPKKTAVLTQNVKSGIYVFLTYLLLKTETINIRENRFVTLFDDNTNNNTVIDLTLESKLFHLAVSFFILIFKIEFSSKKAKKGLENVRK